MARRSRKSAAEGVVELSSHFPWWVGVVGALVAYLVFAVMAGQPSAPTAAGAPQQISSAIFGSVIRTVATVAQYLVPFLLLLGAIISYVRQRKGASLVGAATGASAAQRISGMSWREFELLIAEAFRRKGYTVRDQGGQGPDGGIDLVVLKGKERFLVQCKQWRALKVGVTVVRELFGVMSAEGATGGFVVTSGTFTEDAREFAKGRNIKLIDGPALQQLLEQVQDSGATTPSDNKVDAKPLALPACPKCGSNMIIREARKGPSAGNKFLGCSQFPGCKGTLPL
jgi:restriction system protein